MRLVLLVFAALMLLGEPVVAQKVISPAPSASIPPPLQPPSPSALEAQRPPQEQPGRAQEPAQAQQRGSEENPIVVKALPTDKTDREREQEQRDHDEKASADWWMRILTGALVGVGLLQFLAFIGQIIVFVIQAKRLRDSVNEMRKATVATEKAVIAAQRAANAADRTATAMEDVAEGQLRAYVSVRRTRLTAISSSQSGEIVALEAIAILGNTGDTPTKHLIFHNSMKIFDGDIPADFDFADLDQRQPRRSFIAPKSWVGAFNFRIGREDLVAAQAGRRRIFVWGWVDYDDTFAETARHRTEFCHEIFTVSGVPLAGHAEHWARASQYWRHNAADDECQRRPKPYSAA